MIVTAIKIREHLNAEGLTAKLFMANEACDMNEKRSRTK